MQGCVPLLVQIVHDMNADIVVRHNASEALKNIVTFNQDEKQGRRESRVYKLLESMREYCDTPVVVLKQLDISKHPITAIAALMKLSFDSQHRFAMCVLGKFNLYDYISELNQQFCFIFRYYIYGDKTDSSRP